MKKLMLTVFLGLACAIPLFAQQAFTLVSSEKKTLKLDDLTKIEAQRTLGAKGTSDLTFTGTDLRLVILTGPEDDMLSFRIQGMRNPTLVVPAGATLKILFVNGDEDMRHDVRFGKVTGDFAVAPDAAET